VVRESSQDGSDDGGDVVPQSTHRYRCVSAGRYTIRSVPANPYDSVYCIRLAHAAVHAAMAGRTGMVVGRFVHVPIALAISTRNQVDPDGDLWLSVLEATGQPPRFEVHTSGLSDHLTRAARQSGTGG
jgi:6-phosphofructokinase